MVNHDVEFGFLVTDGLVEGSDFVVESDDASTERVLGGGAEGEEVFDEAGGVEDSVTLRLRRAWRHWAARKGVSGLS